MTDQRIDSEEELNALWDEASATPDDDQDAADNAPQALEEDAKEEDQTPDEDQASSDDNATREELERAEQRLRSEEGRIRKLEERVEQYRREAEELRNRTAPPAPKQEQEQEQADAAQEGMTDDEWETFQEDFPDIAARLKAQNAKIEQVSKSVGEVTAQREREQQEAQQRATEAALESHNNSIRERHSDYDEIAADPKGLVAFIEQQPPLQQRVYQTVMESGSASEIIELLDAYKSDNPPTKRKQKPALAVTTRKSRPGLSSGKADPYDEDAAWEDAISGR